MKKILFIDRDGTLISEPTIDQQVDSLEKLEFLPGVFRNLYKIVTELDFELVIATNQDGLGTETFRDETFWPAQNKMLEAFKNEGILFADVLIDRSFESENLRTRKPGIGMFSKYVYGNYDLANSFVIGDRETDVQLAQNLGCKAILFGPVTTDLDCSKAKNWDGVFERLKNEGRRASVIRQTSETQISIEINLDGTGQSSIDTGIGFFDHMLEQLAKHGAVDLDISVKGDLHIDEHHTVEDTAIALGSAFSKALGSKKGISRYGFLLPMDDCLAQVAIDFGGRPWLVWNAEFKREKVGEMPTEMFFHFFKSFSDGAACNLNIRADGENEHHKIEAIFKSFARAIKMAVKQGEFSGIPSTKGTL